MLDLLAVVAASRLLLRCGATEAEASAETTSQKMHMGSGSVPHAQHCLVRETAQTQ